MSVETKTSYRSAKEELLGALLPEQTRTYKPISHQQLMDLTLESIQGSGFELAEETYASARFGNVATGRYTIKNVADNEMQLQIGWQNSYDKSVSLKFAIGTRIMVCSNGCVHGDFGAFKKKHVGQVQTFTPSAITEYIKSSGDVFTRMQEEREAMKQIELTKRTKAELIGRMMIEEEFIQSTQLNIIMRELKSPTHDYGAQDSLWELYNFATFAMKEAHPGMWMQNHMDAHRFFVNESGVLVNPMKIEVPEPGALKQLNLFNELG
jgi:Domain of unknown function (DUF932)